MNSIVESNSLFEIDAELDTLLDEIQEQSENREPVSEDLVTRFHEFCKAHGEKVDRIGRFVRMMEARETYCRSEAIRLADRARSAAGKVERTKSMALFYLMSRDLRKVEGQQFTLRIQKNSQDSVKITDEFLLPISYRKIEARVDGVLWETIVSHLPEGLVAALEACVQDTRPDTDAIKAAVMRNEEVPGANVRRGSHLRVS